MCGLSLQADHPLPRPGHGGDAAFVTHPRGSHGPDQAKPRTLGRAGTRKAEVSMTGRRQRLASRRRALGLSQELLAAELGVDRTTVGRWERGETDPQPY